MDVNEATPDIIGGAHAKVKHDSAVRHVTGRAVFIDDIPSLPGVLEAVFVISPYAHAKIVSVDRSKAGVIAGVHEVLIAEDIPGRNDIAPVLENEPVLATDVVQYVGHPVAIVVGETYDVAFHAAKEVIVQYEKLEPILSIAQALEKEEYTYPPQIIERGDPIGAIKTVSYTHLTLPTNA